MTIEQILKSGDFKLSVISTNIYGAGNLNRLNYVKNGRKRLSQSDKDKLCKYFKDIYEIYLHS